jgi:regulatory protein YycI of two-component signal transduction system YycFG
VKTTVFAIRIFLIANLFINTNTVFNIFLTADYLTKHFVSGCQNLAHYDFNEILEDQRMKLTVNFKMM